MTSRIAVLPTLILLGACAPSRPRERVIVLGLDGLDPRVVQSLAADGKLPSFSRLLRDGAHGVVTSRDGGRSIVARSTTIATGRRPEEHGIDRSAAVDPRTDRPLPFTSRMRRVRAVWEIVSATGRKVGVVGWSATWPAESVNGFVVSDHTCYHFLFRDGKTDGADPTDVTFPPALFSRIASLVRRPADVTPDEAAAFVDVDPGQFARPFDFRDPIGHFRWTLATADTYRRIGLTLWAEEKPALLMVSVEGVDSLSRLFGHLYRTRGLTGELAEQQRRFGHTVEEMYRYADQMVDGYRKAMDDHTTLLVVSDHGFDLGSVPDDAGQASGLGRLSPERRRADGAVYLLGDRVKKGSVVASSDPLDIVPTVLALLGIGQGRDMPGHVLTEALTLTPPKAVATYETLPRATSATKGDPRVDPEILARLRSLGDLEGAESGQAKRTAADQLFQKGRYAEAAALFSELVRSSPKDAALHTSLAGALAGQGRHKEALAELKVALTLDPVHAPAYHNRGAIYELLGRNEEAVRQYRTALRYRPDYQPSREALDRLRPGEPALPPPQSGTERRASALADQARDEASKGDFPKALRLLEEAERLAPRLTKIFQYQANVAFLMGDRSRAAAALRKALALEPDNTLFRENLKALEEPSAPRR